MIKKTNALSTEAITRLAIVLTGLTITALMFLPAPVTHAALGGVPTVSYYTAPPPPPPVNGACAPTHYSCAAGTLGATAAYSTSWQWWCNGSNGGSNVLCSQSSPPATSLDASLGPVTAFNTGANGGTCPVGWLMVGTTGWWQSYTNVTNYCRLILTTDLDSSLGAPVWIHSGENGGQCPEGYLAVGTTGWFSTYTDVSNLCRPILTAKLTASLGATTWIHTGSAGQCPSGWLMTGTSGWWKTYTDPYSICRQILTPVNGVCAATHYNCSAGTVGATASYSNSWQWWCNGSAGGSSLLCTEQKPFPPTATLTATSPIASGARSTLSWSSANASSCTAIGAWSNASSPLGPKTGLTDPLTTTTTFGFQCTSSTGVVSPISYATVTVSAPPANCSGTISNCTPPSTPPGSSATGNYCVNGYTGTCSYTCNVNGGNSTWGSPSSNTCTKSCKTSWGSIIASGATPIYAFKDATVTAPATCSSQAFTCTDGTWYPTSVSINSYPNSTCTTLHPAATISAAPSRVQPDGSSKITWNATDVSSCTITRNGTSVFNSPLTADASHTVSGSGTASNITSQATFKISCDGAAATASVTVNLVPNFQEF